jgi:hypothetical protein
MDTNMNKTMPQVENNKALIHRYFEAYNTKNGAIFDEIISSNYIDLGQSAYMGAPGLGVAGAKNDLEYSLNKLDEINYVIDGICHRWNDWITRKSRSCRYILERILDTKSNFI